LIRVFEEQVLVKFECTRCGYIKEIGGRPNENFGS